MALAYGMENRDGIQTVDIVKAFTHGSYSGLHTDSNSGSQSSDDSLHSVPDLLYPGEYTDSSMSNDESSSDGDSILSDDSRHHNGRRIPALISRDEASTSSDETERGTML